MDAGAIQLKTFDELLESKKRDLSSSLVSLRQIGKIVSIYSVGIDIPTQGIEHANEIEFFLRTGDFELKANKIVCLNPTLLTLDDEQWEVSCNST